MKFRKKFEFLMWLRFVALLFIGLIVTMTIVEVLAVPALRWVLYDELYKLPSLNRIFIVLVRVVLISLFAGTILWYGEGKMSGRR